MNRYITLLRGINVSGKHVIKMQSLKDEFENLGFFEVKTYINSGNVIFSSEVDNLLELVNTIERTIEVKFDLRIPVTVFTVSTLQDILNHAPDWWGSEDKEIYDNAIFMLGSTQVESVFEALGEPNENIEQVASYQNVIFWSFSLKEHRKTNWSKIASSRVNNCVTIRTANTLRKLIKLA